jgi:hypothetical protein
VHSLAVGRHDGGAGDTGGVLMELEPVEDGAAFAPRPVSKVPALVAEDVEDVQADRPGGRRVAGPAVEAGGEQLEVGPPIRSGNHHLAVQHDITEAGEAIELGQFGGPVVAAARPQPGSSVGHFGTEPPTVVLPLEQVCAS